MPSLPGISMSMHRDVRAVLAGGGEHLVAPADLGDDGDVRLQLQQCPQRPADQLLVLGQQDPDHATPAPAGTSGTSAHSR